MRASKIKFYGFPKGHQRFLGFQNDFVFAFALDGDPAFEFAFVSAAPYGKCKCCLSLVYKTSLHAVHAY